MCVCVHDVTSLKLDNPAISPLVLGAVSVEKGLELENVAAPRKDIIGLAGWNTRPALSIVIAVVFASRLIVLIPWRVVAIKVLIVQSP